MSKTVCKRMREEVREGGRGRQGGGREVGR